MKNKKKFVVIGNPIKHSLSPFLHNYWFKKLKLNCEYKKLKINHSGIKNILELMDNSNQYITKGRNATIQLERDPKGEILISKIIFSKSNSSK
jgi:shikimate dehydrogenase